MTRARICDPLVAPDTVPAQLDKIDGILVGRRFASCAGTVSGATGLKLARRRTAQRGQVLVEAAITAPLTLFMMLGLIQLSLIQQGRLLAQYAAFRAVRAGSLMQADCGVMTSTAVVSLLASYGRTDDANALIKTYAQSSAQGSPSFNLTGITDNSQLKNIVDLQYRVFPVSGTGPGSPYLPNDFDDPGKGFQLDGRIVYHYEMRVPFANWMVSEMFTAGNYFQDKIDPLMLVRPFPQIQPQDLQRISQSVELPNGGSSAGRFFLPLPASSSMRMMSNPPSASLTGAIQDCTSYVPSATAGPGISSQAGN